ncbi:MAG: TetR/AcrR family transcriptional regulator [Pseudomonadota bacterium]
MSQQHQDEASPEPRFQRRKDQRPKEIAQAALEVFAERGFAGARVSDVAERAGVSKGLMYLYYKTKQDLLKAVIRGFIEPRVRDIAAAIEGWNGSAAAFLRGPFLETISQLAASRAVIIIRLMMAEGPNHPDLTKYYYDHVITVGLGALSGLLDRAVEQGEFQTSGIHRYPQLLLAPVVMAAVWQTVFDRHQRLDVKAFLAAHVETAISAMARPQGDGVTP